MEYLGDGPHLWNSGKQYSQDKRIWAGVGSIGVLPRLHQIAGVCDYYCFLFILEA